MGYTHLKIVVKGRGMMHERLNAWSVSELREAWPLLAPDDRREGFILCSHPTIWRMSYKRRRQQSAWFSMPPALCLSCAALV
jgi:hypothetical protein